LLLHPNLRFAASLAAILFIGTGEIAAGSNSNSLIPVITCPPNVTIQCSASTLPANTGTATATIDCGSGVTINYTDVIVAGNCPDNYMIQRLWSAQDNCGNTVTCTQVITVRDTTSPVLTCPADVTIQCDESTDPGNTGMATATDNCSGALTIYADYSESPPADAPEMRWEYLPPGTAFGDCVSDSDCSGGVVCFGLIYTPGMTGTLVSYTTGFYVDCVNGGNPIIYNSSCVMADNSAEFDICATEGDIFMNSSGNTGALPVEEDMPVIIHQICLQLDPDSGINIAEDPITDLTTTVDIAGQGSFDELPGYATYQNSLSEICDAGCPFASTFYRKFIVEDDCGNESTCVQIISTADNTPPVINCPENVTVANAASTNPDITGYPDVVDNCDFEATYFYQDSLVSSPCATIAGVYRRWIADDICGNQSSCVQYIGVSEVTPPDADIAPVNSPVCYYTNVSVQSGNPQQPGFNYNWNFGTGAVPATAAGFGPHTVQYTTTGTKTIKLVMTANQGEFGCADSTTASLMITSCPGQILGYVRDTANVPIVNVNVRLFADTNTNGVADTTVFIRNVFTNASGQYSMASLFPGSYVIVETQPNTWTTVDDYDASNDGDIVPNVSPTDNLIPVTIVGFEIDSMNNFIEMPTPAQINGTVFIDNDFDNVPDAFEGLPGVLLTLLADANTNGVADNSTPVATATTTSNGSFNITNVPVGHYVLVETNPSGYLSVKDFDASNDGDVVVNSNMINDTLPVSLTNNENDSQNYFIDAAICGKVVTSVFDSGYGTLRYNLDCAQSGDTITFHTSLAGMTINITSNQLTLIRDVNIFSSLVPVVTISSTVNGLFTIPVNRTAFLKNLRVIGGLQSGDIGTSFDNAGILKLENVESIRNALVPIGTRHLMNRNASQLILSGNCLIKENQ
jgi:hypothetical protein